MASEEPLISFDLIEEHKENIQQLPGGRSAKSLHAVLSPLSSKNTASREETQTLNSALRNAYEEEIRSIDEADDPLDCYCRYVKWTLNAYPSAQATTESGLRELLERATKAFITSSDYKNDPRYLKLWLQYIQLFSDAPNEIFRFLARHCIGEHLALYYEEFAAWLEGAGRWSQADEVYRLGIEREARPAERLMRKYTQFQQRYEARPQSDNEPSSPALPKVRAALAAKIDPFAAHTPDDASQQQQRQAPAATTTKPKKAKMAIFSDADSEQPPAVNTATKGWDSIGSMKDRKKENSIEARPWAGETLKAGKKVGSTTKMDVFKDPNQSQKSSKPSVSAAVNPKTGRTERAFVDMDALYASDGAEYSFEERRALHRGWMQRDWRHQPQIHAQDLKKPKSKRSTVVSQEPTDLEDLSVTLQDKLDITDHSSQSQNASQVKLFAKPKKTRMREKQETQTIKARLDSPGRPKLKKKSSRSAEPTMTINTKAAHNDAYDMFNNAEKDQPLDDTQSGAETEYEDDTFSANGDTGRISTTNSEFGDDTVPSLGLDDTSASPWSEFTENKSVQRLLNKAKAKAKHIQAGSEDFSSQTQSQDGFDTIAIAALANQDFGELDTVAIAKIAGEEMAMSEDETSDAEDRADLQTNKELEHNENIKKMEAEIQEKPKFVPIPPEDYEPTPLRPYRDPDVVAHNKLPFMTPIVEHTESSLAPSTVYPDQDWVVVTTPSKCKDYDSPSKKLRVDNLLLESPPKTNTEATSTELLHKSPAGKLFTDQPAGGNNQLFSPIQSSASNAPTTNGTIKAFAPITKPAAQPRKPHKGPIIADLQCNPCDQAVRDQILEVVGPDSYVEFHDHQKEEFANFALIRSYGDKLQKQKAAKASPRKSQPATKLVPPMLKFPASLRVYAVKKELGKGAFAPVYLVDSAEGTSDGQDASITPGGPRDPIEAIKAESPPSTLTWEFHILQLIKSRLGTSARAMQSIVRAHECHLFRDECYLVLDYHSQGTLLDLVNHVRNENIRAGKAAEGLEEPVVMWLSVELLRCMEEIHKVGILHGDLKSDNCLVRMNPDVDLTAPFDRHGNCGWSGKGLTLIDFGRGIDMKAFKPDARFVADWDAEETDCPEIREARPWKYEIDLFGAAGIIHSLLFGKYIETVVAGGGGLGQKKEWKLRESFKRYWEKDIWTEVFAVLINGGSKKEDDIKRDLARITSMMEKWLETESERNGRDLRGGIRRCERLVGAATTNKGRR